MEVNKLIKDKNKLLMAIPVVLGILFLYVFSFVKAEKNSLGKKCKQPHRLFWNLSRKWPTR